MSRASTLAALADFAGPLGPFQSIDDYLPRIERWVEAGGTGVLTDLADLVTRPPTEAELGDLSRQEFDDCLGEVLCAAAEQQPSVAVDVLAPLLDHARSRLFAVDALGSTNSRAALDLLRAIPVRGLDPEDAQRIGEAIDEIEERLGGS